MSQTRHYSRAPITEAVIDIRIQPSSEMSLPELASLHSLIQDDYPVLEGRNKFEGQITGGPHVSASATQTLIGYAFTSKDGRQVFQARLDGFTFSRLAPYDTWDSFCNEARRLWNEYRVIEGTKTIERIAVRTINRFDIPLPMNDFKDYFRTLPEVSPALSQGLSGYFMHLELPQEDILSLLIINQAMIQPVNPNVVSVLLDIDLFRQVELPHSEEGIWQAFRELHDRRNTVFEGCITDRTRELIA